MVYRCAILERTSKSLCILDAASDRVGATADIDVTKLSRRFKSSCSTEGDSMIWQNKTINGVNGANKSVLSKSCVS